MSHAQHHCPSCGTGLNLALVGGLCPECLKRTVLAELPALTEGDTEALTSSRQRGVAVSPIRAEVWEIPSPEDLAALLPEEDYSVQSCIGRGGMGAVYKGTQLRLRRPVAIKIMPRARGGDGVFEERFRREAMAMAHLSHPNIVSVIDCGEAGTDYLYIVMEYVDGPDLLKVIRTGCVDQDMVLALVPQICDALQFAHNHGIVHRDIKPGNIMLTPDGRIKIADFGLAKGLASAPSFVTEAGVRMGTPDYAAPEQLQAGAEVDHRVDIYALGVMIYQLITGQLPRGAWPPPSKRSAVHPRWDAVVKKALQLDPKDRYGSATEVRTDVISIGQISAPTVAWWWVVAGVTGAVALAAAGALWLQPERKPAPAFKVLRAPQTDNIVVLGSHHYQFVPGLYHWEFAREQAERVGGHLVTIASEEEHAALDAAFGKFLTGKWASCWIGAFRKEGSSAWEWVTGEPMKFQKWRAGADRPLAFPAAACLLHPDETAPFLQWFCFGGRERDLEDAPGWRGYIVEWDGPLPRPFELTMPSPVAASREKPFINSLGMKFVPTGLTRPGETVLCSIWETRNRDYAAFAAHREGIDTNWQDIQGLDNGPEHPVVNLNWEDAVRFCNWLTDTERARGAIGLLDVYRLPTDMEWSAAVVRRIEPGPTALQTSSEEPSYPWGDAWPPPNNSGNYYDETTHGYFAGTSDPNLADLARRHLAGSVIPGYQDGFPTTAPVGSFPPNSKGIYDTGGNVWEMCWEFSSGPESKDFLRILRGGGWNEGFRQDFLRCNGRRVGSSIKRHETHGFRVVLQTLQLPRK